ncbi:TPA: glycosyltransferase family 4 protein, partial [Escherichia coli]|nr:glycosyltransferase family 4 protein [Escherichia coli]
MMNVAIINSYFPPVFSGGAENSIDHMLHGLICKPQIKKLIMISLSNIHKEVNVVEKKGIIYYYIPYLYKVCPLSQKRTKLDKLTWYMEDFYSTKSFELVLTILQEHKIDIVNTNNLAGFSTAILKVIAENNYKIIHTIRDYYFMCIKGNLNHTGCSNTQGGMCKCLTLVRKYHSKFTTAVVGNSKFILDLHLRNGYFKNSKISRHIYNGYSDEQVKYSKALGSTRNKKIGYIGRICKEKGVEIFIQQSMNAAPDNEIIVAGKGDNIYINQLKKMYPSVKFIGHVSPEVFYNQVDFVIVPSLWHEPLARTVFESYFYGLPVIGSNRGGIPESIVNGVNGFIFDPDNPNSLSDSIKLLAYDDEV